MKFYRIIADCAAEHLTDDGVIMTEVGYDQAAEVVKLFKKIGKSEVVKDLDGIERIVVCRK